VTWVRSGHGSNVPACQPPNFPQTYNSTHLLPCSRATGPVPLSPFDSIPLPLFVPPKFRRQNRRFRGRNLGETKKRCTTRDDSHIRPGHGDGSRVPACQRVKISFSHNRCEVLRIDGVTHRPRVTPCQPTNFPKIHNRAPPFIYDPVRIPPPNFRIPTSPSPATTTLLMPVHYQYDRRNDP